MSTVSRPHTGDEPTPTDIPATPSPLSQTSLRTACAVLMAGVAGGLAIAAGIGMLVEALTS